MSLSLSSEKEKNVAASGKQLLLNNFSHPKSSLLLFPYAPVVNFINHADSTASNVEIRWSQIRTGHRGKEWPQSLTLEQLNQQTHTGLVIE